MKRDTIVALGTPPGEAGIAVIRISGRRAVEILSAMAPGADRWESHKLHKKILRGTQGEYLDEVLAVVMRSPDSYTGEDVVEISCHGNMFLTTSIIDEAIRLGAVSAGPGEFTRRAYLNGKLDLVQAEAVADLIAAETRLQSRVALEHLEGRLSRNVREIERELLESLSLVEAAIDFSEEDIEIWSYREIKERSGKIRKKLLSLIDSQKDGNKLRKGIRVTILGPRNAGKSSLYNALLGEERAIVSAVPGTTRDLLRERIHIGGFTYHLEDTAGIAETGCEIESRGISMGREAARGADLVLFVVDGAADWSVEAERELDGIDPGNCIVVLNKSDLGIKEDPKEISARSGIQRVLTVSAKEGEGLDNLREGILEKTVEGKGSEIRRERIAVNARQGAALREAAEALERLENGRDGGEEIVSLELREAIEACGKVTGRSVAQDLLDMIFDRFCIGK